MAGVGYEKTITSVFRVLCLSLSRISGCGKSELPCCGKNQLGAKERRNKMMHEEEQRKSKALGAGIWKHSSEGQKILEGLCILKDVGHMSSWSMVVLSSLGAHEGVAKTLIMHRVLKADFPLRHEVAEESLCSLQQDSLTGTHYRCDYNSL